MHWLFIAIISPLLSSIIHHTDKYLLSKFTREHSIGSLILFSSLFPIVILPFFSLSREKLFALSSGNIFTLTAAGILSALSLLFYFYALEEEETSLIAPMFQLTPIFGYILGILVFNEMLNPSKILGAIVVILGATILSFEFEEEGGLRFKIKPTLLMLAASLLLALNDSMFKKVAMQDGSYATSMFWVLVGSVAFGLALFCFAKNYRKSFLATIEVHGKKIIGVNLFNELLQTLATFAFNYALLLAPLALVLLVDAYQPLFVFIIGIILTKYFPHIATEKISLRHILHKVLAVTLLVIGSAFVYS